MQGLLPILTIIFMVLKLCGVITWSWWLVFSPMLLGLGILCLVLIFIIFILFKIKKESKASWGEVIKYYMNNKGNK